MRKKHKHALRKIRKFKKLLKKSTSKKHKAVLKRKIHKHVKRVKKFKRLVKHVKKVAHKHKKRLRKLHKHKKRIIRRIVKRKHSHKGKKHSHSKKM